MDSRAKCATCWTRENEGSTVVTMWHTATHIGTEHLTRLLSQLPALMWSTDTGLQLTSRYGGVLAGSGVGARTPQGPSPSRIATCQCQEECAPPTIAAPDC